MASSEIYNQLHYLYELLKESYLDYQLMHKQIHDIYVRGLLRDLIDTRECILAELKQVLASSPNNLSHSIVDSLGLINFCHHMQTHLQSLNPKAIAEGIGDCERKLIERYKSILQYDLGPELRYLLQQHKNALEHEFLQADMLAI